MCVKINFDNPASVEQSLFKFYPNRDYHLEAFRRGELFLAKPKMLNDGFDTTRALIEPFNFFKQLVKWNDKNAEAFENHGICSFIESPDVKQQRMWALYADSFNGFVIEFNAAAFKNSRYAPIELLPVKYLEKPLNLDDLNLSIHVNGVDVSISELQNEQERNADYIFKCLHLVKNKAVWGDEREWRLIKGNLNPFKADLCNEHSNRTGYILQISDDFYKSIYIGERIPPQIRESLTQIAKNRGKSVFIVKPQIIDGKWDMMIEPIA